MQVQSMHFKKRVSDALRDAELQSALGVFAKQGFAGKRAKLVEQIPQWQQIRSHAKTIREHTFSNLDFYLQRYEEKVLENGGTVHWASDDDDARVAIAEICRAAGARTIAKGKSMVSEEIALNDHLEGLGYDVVETDLGEYIIQLADEAPSHIIAPAIHKTKEQVSELFHQHHDGPKIDDRGELVAEARRVLRDKFLNADVGITGANFLIAETGQHVLVTNEGNGDLCSSLPRVHIVITGIEKVLPTLEDTSCILRLLGASATGQQISNYTSFYSGPRHADHLDGPEQYHVILVDNGRSEMLGNELREMLRCIRCGACLNHCPVYGAIGGHSYGWVYTGPMGSVITPAMVGLEQSRDLPNACTLNGRCAEVCPMSIPLPDLLRSHRSKQWRRKLVDSRSRLGLGIWAWFARHPRLYHTGNRLAMTMLRWLGGKSGAVSRLPFARAWTNTRDLPVSGEPSFMSQWQRRQQQKGSQL